MTEAEWRTSNDPVPMLEFVRGRASERRLRLLGAAYARVLWERLGDERSRRAVVAAEQYVDGAMAGSALEAVAGNAWDVRDELLDAGPAHDDDRLWLAEAAALTASVFEWRGTFSRPGPLDGYPFRLPLPAHCGLLRCLYGDPFRPVAADPGWRTSAVVGLAAGIYEDRAWDRLPVLADALEDAGCADADVLGHLRGPGPHARGCWVVDLILGKS